MNEKEIKALDAVVNWVLREEPEEASSEHIYNHAQTLKTFLAMKSMTKNERLARVCQLLFQLNREEILRDGDWWFGTDHYDFNFFDWGGDPTHVSVSVYDMTKKNEDDYLFKYSPEKTIYNADIYMGVPT